MATRTDRINVFNDTIAWINSDPRLSNAVAYSKAHTDVYHEDEYPVFDNSKIRDTLVDVTQERTFEAATKLSWKNPNSRIAVLNFANAFQPGGGVTSGSSAQEESLCRCSTLYPLLYRRSLAPLFYGYHKKLNRAEATDSVIYTEDVVICKTDTDMPERLPSDSWIKVDVITAAAPDLRHKSNIHVQLTGNGTVMTDAQLYACHLKRAIHIMTVAAAKHVDILVLGAFGCGAFENNPEVVAKAYYDAIEIFPKMFKKIVFAIYSSNSAGVNYLAFEKQFRDEMQKTFMAEYDPRDYIDRWTSNGFGITVGPISEEKKAFIRELNEKIEKRAKQVQTIKKITLWSYSGFGTIDTAYEDKLVLTPDSISYEYKPKLICDGNSVRKWSYKSSSSEFLKKYNDLLPIMPVILEKEPREIMDAPGITIKVVFEDKTTEEYDLSFEHQNMGYLLEHLRSFVPPMEELVGLLEEIEE